MFLLSMILTFTLIGAGIGAMFFLFVVIFKFAFVTGLKLFLAIPTAIVIALLIVASCHAHSVTDDICTGEQLTEEEMQYLIDYYTAIHPDSALNHSEMAKVFIKASVESQIDPIVLFCIQGIECGWGSQRNPYSIMTGYYLGDDFNEEIINGAVWIKENFYDAGQTSLYSMNHGGNHSYADPSSTSWEKMIASEISFNRKRLARYRDEKASDI